MRAFFIPCLVAGLLVSACGGSDNGISASTTPTGGTSTGASTTPLPSGPRLLSSSAITGVGTGTNFSFDLGLIVGNRYYVTDRNNAAVDVFDTATSTQVAQIKGAGANAFTGVGLKNGAADNSISGPDGINIVGSLLYVGDVDSVKVIDPASQQILKNIAVGTSGKRADEGCVDATHNLYMISTPEADTPFATFINTNTQAVVAQVDFTDASGNPSAGLEQCRYDAASQSAWRAGRPSRGFHPQYCSGHDCQLHRPCRGKNV
jgi:hypothetical protein